MPAETPSEAYQLNKADKALNILTLPEEVFVHRYAPTVPVPSELWQGDDFCSVTKTKNELSIVASNKRVADAGMPKAAPQHCGGPWNVLRVRGPLEHHMVGVMAELARVLKEASVSIFTISTWDTDYLLVTKDTYEAAKKALESDGWTFA